MDNAADSSGLSGAGAAAVSPGRRPRFFLFWAFNSYVPWLAASLLVESATPNDLGFLLAPIVLAAPWYWLHAVRLRDAGYGVAPARGVLAIYLLAVALLHLLIYFMDEPGRGLTGYSVMVIRQLVTFSRGFGDPLGYLAWIGCLALLIPPAFSIWTALQPKRTA